MSEAVPSMAPSWLWGSKITVKQIKKDGLELAQINLFMSANFITNPQDEQNIKFERNLLICQLTFLVEAIASMALQRTQSYQVYILA